MMLILLVATPLFTSGTALIEAGAEDRGESTLEALLSTSITEEMRNRALYNLGVAALDQAKWNDALSNFQQIEGDGGDLKPFIQQGIQIALKNKPQVALPPFNPLPTPVTLQDATKEVGLLLRHTASLPFVEGEKSPEYGQIKSRLETLLSKKKEWWNSVVSKQVEMAPKGCFQQHWEGLVQRLSESTQLLEKADHGFNAGAKPYATLFPLLQDALADLQMVFQGIATEQKGGGKQPEQTERFQTLSEMFRKDETATPPVPKGALW